LHTLDKIYTAHYSNNLLNIVSKDIVKQYKGLLPDLRSITLFLPNQLSQSILREAIIEAVANQGYDAIFPPEIITLRQWARNKYEINKPVLSQYARELILVDAIKQQPDLFSGANPWAVASELLSLFDSMALNGIEHIQFNNYYKGENQDISHALLHESDLVKVLWQAWQVQIVDENYLDPNHAYADALKNINTSKKDIFYCVGLDQLSKLECDFLNKTAKQSDLLFFSYAANSEFSNRADIWLKKYLNSDTQCNFIQSKTNNPYSSLLDEVFIDNSLSIKQRAEAFAKIHADPLPNRLSIYKSNHFEQHIQAIDLQIRIWINENKKNIGVVTNDRKLVRRLRAVLEHADITVNDAAGWALSTTSAAVVIEWWLQLAEERYPAKQLLALVNSPFFPVANTELHERAVNYFEKEIILAFNLHNGIHRFRKAIEKAQAKDNFTEAKIFDYLTDLLDKIEASSQLITKLHGSKSYPLHRIITELINSLKPIGLYTTLSSDDAGKQIIDLFEDQASHFKLVDNLVNWSEARRFMSRVFDQQNYKPPTSKTSVTFYSLDQSRLHSFDALVIASVDKSNFPGNSSNYIFFNEQVRTELNIPTWRDDHARHLHQFRSLLDSSEQILITVQIEQNGEKTSPCPWLEAIETFYHMAYGHMEYEKDLADKRLEYLISQASTSVSTSSDIALPSQSTQPNPVLIPALKPDSISISQYQSLVNCPYQYFALSCLKLSQTDELSEELGKADFGSLVHQCIHAFFTNLPAYPGPFTNKVTTHNRKEAEEMLCSISNKVFSQTPDTGSEDDFNNALWLHRWLNLIPRFMDWEIKRQATSTPISHEESMKITINQSSRVHGRLDRIDKLENGYAIVDYKTGLAATKKSIDAGEEVQLPMYALLNDTHQQEISSDMVTSQVEFVSIGKDNSVKSSAIIKQDELNNLKNKHLHRLQTFFESLNHDTAFTALATDETCERCDAFGVCRKSAWDR
jgi:ATP-dependent helicase/nuclease subunit B